MRKYLTLLGVAGLLLAVVRDTWAHMGDKVFPVVELTDAELARIDISDGSVEDWIEVVGEPTMTALDFSTDPTLAAYEPADLDFRIWLAWHRATHHIYIAMERSDDLYLNELNRDDKSCLNLDCSPTNQDSSIEFYVDGDHSGGQIIFSGAEAVKVEEILLRSFQTAQRYDGIAEVPDLGPQVYIPFTTLYADWFVKPPYADGGGGVVDSSPAISVTEFYVTPFDRFVWNSPEESVISDLFPGKTIGIALVLMDVDTNNHRWESIFYMPYQFPDHAEQFADVILLGPGGTLPEGSAVEDDSWARIKASFDE